MMERSREGRKVNIHASKEGLSRRRHRSNSRDSPEDDGPGEYHEPGPGRLRDRAAVKKDRDRMMSMISRSSKRRRRGRRPGDVALEESSEDESVEDEDEEEYSDDECAGPASSVTILPPNSFGFGFPSSSSSSSSFPNHHHRKSFPPQPPPPVGVTMGNKVSRFLQAPPWKAPEEVIGVSVPRKARSASTKGRASRVGGGGVSDQIHRQASSGPSVPALQASASSSPPAPVSPSSSNPPVKKKMKPNGAKLRPPKSSYGAKAGSSTQEEIEFEVAEVLYGMMRQPQGPCVVKPEASSPVASDSVKSDSREVENGNKSAVDAKSRVSSPTSGSAPSLSATAPKRKRLRPIMYEDENPAVFPVRSSPKGDVDQPEKVETCSPNSEKTPGSVPALTENSEIAVPPSAKEPQSENTNVGLVDSKPTLTKEMEVVDSLAVETKDEPKDSLISGVTLDEDPERFKANKGNSGVSEVETERGEKFEIDLMAPPPPLRSPPERDNEIDCVAVGPKPMVTDVETEVKPPLVKGDDKGVINVGQGENNMEPEEEKSKVMGEVESQLPVANKERKKDLQLNLEKNDKDGASISENGSKTDKDSASVSENGSKLNQHAQKQQHQMPPPNLEKSAAAQPNSLPVPISITGWPGGLPHIGYMAHLPGVVSREASNLSSVAIQPPHFLFSQQRPKRCATHCYIAKNIHCHQQFTKMNPFWPSVAGSTLQYGAKMGVLPSTQLHASRGVNPGQEKEQGLTVFPGSLGKDKNPSAVNTVDAGQRKQILLQQPVPPGVSSNILHGPAFIFPLSQQQPVALASVQPGAGKCLPTDGGASLSNSSSSASVAAAATPAMSFNYPSMAVNETPYLAILQNGAYPIPIPAQLGASPAYRGTHPQPMPFFDGSVYSSQMLQTGQIQQQPPPSQSQGQQSNQFPSTSASASSQKHLQNQQQNMHVGRVNGGGANLQGFPAQSDQSLQSVQFQQWQQLQKPGVSHQPTKHNGEGGNEDNRGAQANTNIYGQNFVVPFHPPNFNFLNHVVLPGANGGTADKKQQQLQLKSPNAGVESLPSQAYAMSFASINGVTTAPGFGFSSVAQNPAVLSSFPEATKHGSHFLAAATTQTQQQKKRYRAPDQGKVGKNDSSKTEEDRKGMAAGANAQSIAFPRPDSTDLSVTPMAGSSIIESSVRALNRGPTGGQSSGSVISSAGGNVSAPGGQQPLKRTQQQQMIQLPKYQQFSAPASSSVQSKAAATSNGSAYSDRLSSPPSSVLAKLPNAPSMGSVPNNSSPIQSHQWKNSAKTATSHPPPPSSLSSNSSAPKNVPQQQSRCQQSHTQMSFAANPKSTNAPQGQPISTSDQSPSSPAVGSPTMSISKSAGGSPSTTSTSTGNKGGHSSTLSSQTVKNSMSLHTQKSSPATGRNVPSILGHLHVATSSPGFAGKGQLLQMLPQQHQQQLSKLALPHSQMMYGGLNEQLQIPHPARSTDAVSTTSLLGLQRCRSEQQHPQGALATSSTGMLSLCSPASLANTNTSNPAKASVAALSYIQLGAAQSSRKPHQLAPAGLYAHSVPAAVQVKQTELKQPAGE